MKSTDLTASSAVWRSSRGGFPQKIGPQLGASVYPPFQLESAPSPCYLLPTNRAKHTPLLNKVCPIAGVVPFGRARWKRGRLFIRRSTQPDLRPSRINIETRMAEPRRTLAPVEPLEGA